MHTIFLIVGESGSGKDTLVSKICSECGYNQLLSYTTRPQREGENNTHIFITPNETYKYKDEIIAYTQIGEYEYFATLSQLEKSNFYIIDYEGIKYMNNLNINMPNIRFVTIFINTPRNIREQRALTKRKDNVTAFYKRCFNEEIQFKEMLVKCDFDYCISNINFDKAYKIFKNIVKVELTNENNNKSFAK